MSHSEEIDGSKNEDHFQQGHQQIEAALFRPAEEHELALLCRLLKIRDSLYS